MKIEVKQRKNKDEGGTVHCPRLNQEVDTMRSCHPCYWLAICTAEFVRCRWTKEKEELKTGRRHYEAT